MALADCKKAGIHLIGSNESYYGLNKKRVLYERADCSGFGPIQDDEIVLSDIYSNTIRLCGCRSDLKVKIIKKACI